MISKRLGQPPRHNLDSVLDRRFEKVRRQNDIRVQVRQDPNVTARVTFAQGANVTTGQVIPFGTTIITGGGMSNEWRSVTGRALISEQIPKS